MTEQWFAEISCCVIYMSVSFFSAGYAEALGAAECECDTAFQQCRKQYGCDYYYQSLYVRMVARTLPGGPTQGAGSGNPCATCVSII